MPGGIYPVGVFRDKNNLSRKIPDKAEQLFGDEMPLQHHETWVCPEPFINSGDPGGQKIKGWQCRDASPEVTLDIGDDRMTGFFEGLRKQGRILRRQCPRGDKSAAFRRQKCF